MDFGTALKEERKKVKLTQQKLADTIGMSRTYLSDVENNRYKPSVDFIKKVSSALASDESGLEANKIFSKFMTAAAYSLPDENSKEFVYSVFLDTENEILERFPTLRNERFKSFFDDIEDFRESTYHDVIKVGFNDPEDIRAFYMYRLGKTLPFDNSLEDFDIKLYLFREAGHDITENTTENIAQSKYDLMKLKKILTDTTFVSFQQKAFDSVVNTLNEAYFLNFGLPDIISMYSHNISHKNEQVKDLLTLLDYFENKYEGLSEFIESNPNENPFMLEDLSIELYSIKHQINEIKQHLNK